MKTLVLLIACSISCSVFYAQDCGSAQWLYPQPQGNTLTDVFFVDDNTGFAVGYRGTIIKTTNGGAAWSVLPSVTDNDLNKVQFVNSQVGYAVGNAQTILKTANGGATWQKLEVTASLIYNLYDLSFVSADTGYVAGAPSFGQILKTTNGGQSWEVITVSVIYEPNYVSFITSQLGYAAGSGGSIYKTTNGGESWTAQTSGTSNSFWGIQFADANTGYAFTSNAQVYKTTDGGTNWVQKGFLTFNARAMAVPSPDTCYIAGHSSIYRTVDGGENWISVKNTDLNTFGETIEGCHFSSGPRGCVVGGGSGEIFTTTSSGNSWTERSTGHYNSNADVFFTSPTNGVVSCLLFMLRTTDGGNSWNLTYDDFGIWDDAGAVYFPTPDTGYVTTSTGELHWTTDNGQHWSELVVLSSNSLNAIHFANRNMGIAVGNNGSAFRTTDAGATWDTLNTGTTKSLSNIYFASSSIAYAIGDSGLVIKTTDAGNTWNQLVTNTGNYLYALHFLNENTGVVAGASGLVLKTNDGGATWEASTVYTQDALRDVRMFSNTEIFVLGYNNVYRTLDGENWSTLRTPASQSLNAFHLFNVDSAIVVGANTSIIKLFSPQNLAPSDISISNDTVYTAAPDTTFVGILASSDPEGGNVSFEFANSFTYADNQNFFISNDSLYTRNSFFFAPDTKEVAIVAYDDCGMEYFAIIDIHIKDAPSTSNYPPYGLQLSNTYVDETAPVLTTVGTFTSQDGEGGPFYYSFETGGQDNSSFLIINDTLKTNALFDYDVKNTYSISVRTTDPGSLSYSRQFIISILPEGTSSVSSAREFRSHIAPNPFKEFTAVNVSLSRETKLTVAMYDALGREVLTLPTQVYHAGRQTIEIRRNELKSGIYFLKLTAENQTAAFHKVVVED